jgi:formamidopyrimidine-DNA glycosylase
MPELPEVEVLRRHLRPLLAGRLVQSVHIHRSKVVQPTKPAQLCQALRGAWFEDIERRGKYLLFIMRRGRQGERFTLLGHLGMTGRMFLAEKGAEVSKHAAVRLELDQWDFIYDDPRYFGRFTLDLKSVARLGPEPLEDGFTTAYLYQALRGCRQAIKTKLLDQSLVAGVGNIYACEALYRSGISPRRRGGSLTKAEVATLCRTIRRVLAEAIRLGSTIPLDFAGTAGRDGLFYYGSAVGREDFYAERLRVYDQAGEACPKCGKTIRRIVQGGRGTYYCPGCQK